MSQRRAEPVTPSRGRRVGSRLAAALAGCALWLSPLALAPRVAGAAPPVARPGTLVRWAGAGVTACGMAGWRFEPIAGACLYPIDLLHPPGALRLLRWRAGRREAVTVRVSRPDYPVQRLTLPPAMVELSPADAARVRRESREIARLWSHGGERRFTLPLLAPLDPLPEGGGFGSRRVINGRWRSPHGGVDFAAPEGAPVVAAADGFVALVGDHFFGGHSVYLEHGDGLVTTYMHLSRVDVSPGQPLRRGALVGAVGSTGRATGPHLHFGVRWRAARVDPRLLLGDPGQLPAIE